MQHVAVAEVEPVDREFEIRARTDAETQHLDVPVARGFDVFRLHQEMLHIRESHVGPPWMHCGKRLGRRGLSRAQFSAEGWQCPQGGDRTDAAYWVARSRSSIRSITKSIPTWCLRLFPSTAARCWRAAAASRSGGPDKFHRFVVIEFPTFEQGVACFQSAEYNKAAAFRRGGAGEVGPVMVDAGDATPR